MQVSLCDTKIVVYLYRYAALMNNISDPDSSGIRFWDLNEYLKGDKTAQTDLDDLFQ